MITRRELFTWFRKKPAEHSSADPVARPVLEPVWIDDAKPFSLEAFYQARAEQRRR
jgi:hypothetical protein